jgi:hypothetical protein
MNAEMKECIEWCQACAEICASSIAHCLTRGGAHAEPDHIGLLIDCAEACRASLSFLQRGSPLHASSCAFCAGVCKQCEESCEELQSDDEVMKRCADACRSCFESCRKMAGMKPRGAAIHPVA